MRNLFKAVAAFGLVGVTLTLGATPAHAQFYGRRVVVAAPVYAPGYVVRGPVVRGPIVAAPVVSTVYSAPVVAASPVVPAGYTTTTYAAPTTAIYSAPVPTGYYSAPAYIAPMRTRMVVPRRAYRYYPY